MVVFNNKMYMALDQAPADARIGTWFNDCQFTPIAPSGNWYVLSQSVFCMAVTFGL